MDLQYLGDGVNTIPYPLPSPLLVPNYRHKLTETSVTTHTVMLLRSINFH